MSTKKTKDLDQDLQATLFFHEFSHQKLVQIVKGQIDLQELAKRELANRGRNLEGKDVGLDRARAQNLNLFWSPGLKRFVTIPDREEDE